MDASLTQPSQTCEKKVQATVAPNVIRSDKEFQLGLKSVSREIMSYE